MSDYKKYGLLLCLIVFTVFTVLFTVMLGIILKSTLRLIRCGAEDEKIKTEYEKASKRKQTGYFGKFISAIFCVFLCLFCAFSIGVNIIGENYSLKIPTVSVVKSSSMSQKSKTNYYLFDNDLNNQLQTFDLIVTNPLPAEEDLQLYDIVVYEVDNTLVVHRIVGIEEPNEKHPDERYFLLQGDALENPDRFPVHYEQMRAIYAGKRVPFVGSFVLFLQSPAGYLCIILILFSLIATPIMEKQIEKAKAERFALLSGANPLSVLKAKGKAIAQVNSVENAENSAQVLPPIWGAPIYLYPVYHDPNGKGGSKQ